jgi:hypothetical protein
MSKEYKNLNSKDYFLIKNELNNVVTQIENITNRIEKKYKFTHLNLLDFEVWKREKGYWFGEYTFLNSNGNVNYEASDDPTSGQYNYKKYYGFINLQIKGNELRQKNIFIRPPLDLESKDLNSDGVVSIDELDKFGFTSTYDYLIDLDNKIATPVIDNEEVDIKPFNYNEGTEKTFIAEQSASDENMIYQNQLTTLPNNTTRIRTAQGFYNGFSTYVSYYREIKIEDELDENKNIVKSAKTKFLEKFLEYREKSNVPEINQIKDINEFFTTGIED